VILEQTCELGAVPENRVSESPKRHAQLTIYQTTNETELNPRPRLSSRCPENATAMFGRESAQGRMEWGKS